MKNVQIISLTIFALLFLTLSCSKSQKKVNKMNGAWTLHIVDGVELQDDDKVSFIFDQCIMRNKEYCDVQIFESDTIIAKGYKVSNKGEELVIQDYVIPFCYTNTTQIVELGEKNMTLSSSGFGNTVVLELMR